MDRLRDAVVESIEIALVELRRLASPLEMAELAELRLDAKDADDEDQLLRIETHLAQLRAFCERRFESTGELPVASVARG
jgi:hypothetical protein